MRPTMRSVPLRPRPLGDTGAELSLESRVLNSRRGHLLRLAAPAHVPATGDNFSRSPA